MNDYENELAEQFVIDYLDRDVDYGDVIEYLSEAWEDDGDEVLTDDIREEIYEKVISILRELAGHHDLNGF